MKKLIALLFLIPSLCLGQATRMQATYGAFEGIPYVFWDGAGTDLVVVAQGAGEFATSLTQPNLSSINVNSYAQNALRGESLPFDVLVAQSYKGPGMSGNPSQVYLRSSLSKLIKSFNATAVIGTGYSYGAQLMAGFLTESRNGNDTTTLYLGSDIFDGYVLMCGQAPGIPDWSAHKEKPVFIIHGEKDASIPVGNGAAVMKEFNATTPKYKVFPNYELKYLKQLDPKTYKVVKSWSEWVEVEVPDSAVSRFTLIKYIPDVKDATGKVVTKGNPAGHAQSWLQGYNLEDPIGSQVGQFIKFIGDKKKSRPISCTAELDIVNMTATFTLPDGNIKTYHLTE